MAAQVYKGLTGMQQGTFRGVLFGVRSQDSEGGRRVANHEYPGRDEPWAEDLGRKARTHNLEMILVGADYMQRRDKLVSALEEGGSATLFILGWGVCRCRWEHTVCAKAPAKAGWQPSPSPTTKRVALSFPTKAWIQPVKLMPLQLQLKLRQIQISPTTLMSTVSRNGWLMMRSACLAKPRQQ